MKMKNNIHAEEIRWFCEEYMKVPSRGNDWVNQAICTCIHTAVVAQEQYTSSTQGPLIIAANPKAKGPY